jgi:hypothetical protein
MAQLTSVHWLDTQEVNFFMRAMTMAAEDRMQEEEVGSGGGAAGSRRAWVAPHDAIYSWANSQFTRRSKNCLETVNINNNEFVNDRYTKTYIQTGVVNEPGHWTFTSILMRQGDPTHKASTCTAIDTLRTCTELAQCNKSKLHTLCRASMYSLESTEPSRLGVPLMLPVHSQQDDGSSCGAMALAYMCLTAMGVMDPHANSVDDPKAPWNIDIPTGPELYKWLGDVLESVNVGPDCEPVRKPGATSGWMPLPPFERRRVSWEGHGEDHVCSTVTLVTPFQGAAKLAAAGAYAYKHVKVLKPGRTSTGRPGTYILRELVDDVYRRRREAEGLEELVVPEPPYCEFGCGRITEIPKDLPLPSVDNDTYCVESGCALFCRPRGARLWSDSREGVEGPGGAAGDGGDKDAAGDDGDSGDKDAAGDDRDKDVAAGVDEPKGRIDDTSRGGDGSKDAVRNAPADVAVDSVGGAKGDKNEEDKGAVRKTRAEVAVEGVGGAEGTGDKTGDAAAVGSAEPSSKRRRTNEQGHGDGKHACNFGFGIVLGLD